MEPTATALALEVPVVRAVISLREALRSAHAFSPETASGIVRIAALDAEQAVVVPRLMARVLQHAPQLRLSVMPLGRRAAIDALMDGRADLALGFLWDAPDAVISRTLYEDSFLVAGHPAMLPDAPHIALDAYCQAHHVLVSPGGDLRGVVDGRLETMDRTRHVALSLPSFLPALAAIAASDAIATLPSRIARAFAPGFGLVLAEPPLEIRHFPVSVFWHRRNDQDRLTRWLVELCED